MKTMRLSVRVRISRSAIFLVCSALPLSAARANRPLIRTAVAIKNLELSIPIPFEEASQKDYLGLDRDDKAVREKILSQATAYAKLRSSNKGSVLRAWAEECSAKATNTSASGKPTDENPFCSYEQSRKLHAIQPKPSIESQTEHKRIAGALREGRLEDVQAINPATLASVLKQMDTDEDLNKLGLKIADAKECVSSALAYSVGYKIEENFPDEAAVQLVSRVYKRASDCDHDLYSARASFRLGLLDIWKNKCEDVPDLMAKVEGIREASGFHARASYWSHYCANRSGNAVLKEAARDALLREHPLSFQTLAISGDDPTAIAQILREGTTSQVAIRSLVRGEMNSMVRAIEALIRVGSPNLAAEMADRDATLIAELEPEVRLYLAVLMNRIGYALPKFKILTALFQDVPKTVTSETMRMFFPLWYIDIVKKQEKQVDPLLILSLIRQESAFNKEARSGVGARGLMQVMPATAHFVSAVRARKLYDPVVNIGVGTKYFLQRLHQYDGDVELTLAAYNAGFARVEQWKKRYPTDNRMLFLDLIPFKETREYVSSILRNYYWYVKLYEKDVVAVEPSKLAENAKPVEITLPPTKAQAIMNATAGIAAMPAPKINSLKK